MSPLYAYRAVDSTGHRIRGRTEAASAGALTHALERTGHIVFEVDAVDEATLHDGRRFGRARGILEFTRACAALLGAGMPVARALSTAALATVIESVRERVERGTALAKALGQHPAFFSPVYAGVVRAGERSDDLTNAFERLTRRRAVRTLLEDSRSLALERGTSVDLVIDTDNARYRVMADDDSAVAGRLALYADTRLQSRRPRVHFRWDARGASWIDTLHVMTGTGRNMFTADPWSGRVIAK